jgi:hypothetical protein
MRARAPGKESTIICLSQPTLVSLASARPVSFVSVHLLFPLPSKALTDWIWLHGVHCSVPIPFFALLCSISCDAGKAALSSNQLVVRPKYLLAILFHLSNLPFGFYRS